MHHSVQGFHQAVCDVADRFRREHLETLEHLLSGADHDDNEMDGGGSAVIEDRYYSKAEYGKMSQGDKKLLWDRRQKRGGQEPRKGTPVEAIEDSDRRFSQPKGCSLGNETGE